jgi:hypothetical protein
MLSVKAAEGRGDSSWWKISSTMPLGDRERVRLDDVAQYTDRFRDAFDVTVADLFG